MTINFISRDKSGTAYYLADKGMGGFLNPPQDAEHSFSIQEGIGRSAGSMSLRYALTQSYVPDEVKEIVRKILEENQPVITEEWIVSVYAYFAHCYSIDGIRTNVNEKDNIVTFSRWNHNEDQEAAFDKTHHLAHLFITKFFPKYPVRTDLINDGK